MKLLEGCSLCELVYKAKVFHADSTKEDADKFQDQLARDITLHHPYITLKILAIKNDLQQHPENYIAVLRQAEQIRIEKEEDK